MAHVLSSLLVCAMAAAIAGCGGQGAPQSQVPTDAEFMTEVKQLLADYQQATKKAPAKVADLERYEPGNPGGYMQLYRGEVVYAWGVPVTAGGTRVIAHKKDVATAGGSVLMEDGTITTMTAAEFAAAPKAAAKK